MLNKYFDILFRLYAYLIGYIYLVLPYLLSFIIPPLKKTINSFEEIGSHISILIISLVSGSAWFCLFVVVDSNVCSASQTSALGLVGMYIAYFIGGYFGLFLLADYRMKAKHKENS